MDEKIDIVALLREHPEKARFPGALLTRKGPKDYVGSVLVMSAMLYFKNAHTPQVREAICECFEEYEAIAKNHLTWLWREEPPEGPAKQQYSKAKSMREMIVRMNENDAVSFGYISGENPEDAGDWQFEVQGIRGWQAQMGTWGLCSLQFSLPMLHAHDAPLVMPSLFVSFARRLRAVHGYAGPALNLSLVRSEENEPFEAYMSDQVKGLDVGHELWTNRKVTTGIKTVSWLTAINYEMVEKIGGLSAIRSELPADWFALYDYGSGLVIQAGPKANPALVKIDPMPAIYVLPNMLLKDVRAPDIGSLHNGSIDGEPRIVGWAAKQWLNRFDIEDDELMAYKAKLFNEPKLTNETTLLDRL
jgi:hypothetical protein